MSPVKITKVNGYKVSTPGGTKAKSTTKAKAQRQANLLRAIDHGWVPTGSLLAKRRRNDETPCQGLSH